MKSDSPHNQPQISITSQSDAFLKSEGDHWFERNKDLLRRKINLYDTKTIKRVLEHDSDRINHILEIGSGNGVKLNDLCEYFDANGAGVDPSEVAIKDGLVAYSNLRLSVATASDLPFSKNSFDLVYFGFCLYLVDRSDIFKAISEADRVLKPGGFLAILDFDPIQRHKRPYHHLPGLFSYKTSYAEFFMTGGHYYLIAKESFSHDANHFTANSDERVSISILYKEIDPYASCAA